MEAEYYQAGPPLHCPCTTRRRKRDDDEDLDSPPPHMDPAGTEAHQAEEKLKAVAQELGHEVRVFSSEKFAAIPSKLPGADQEEDDEFYELQPADYFNLISNRMAEQSKMLKTRKIREAELAAQRAKRTKAVMRVRFPDGYILEADFLPSERIHSLVELLMKVIARPDLPFYLYTVPPKKRILDTSQDFYTVGFVPGANVHFSYDLAKAFQFYKVMSPQAFEGNTTHRKHVLTQTHTHSMETASCKNAGKCCVHKTQSGSALNTDDVKSGPYLREEIRSLDGLSLLSKPASHDSRMNTSSANQPNESQSDSAAATNKKPNRPKWFKR